MYEGCLEAALVSCCCLVGLFETREVKAFEMLSLQTCRVVVPPRVAVNMATARAREALVSVSLECSVGIHAFPHGRIRDSSCMPDVSSRCVLYRYRVDATAVYFKFPNSPQSAQLRCTSPLLLYRYDHTVDVPIVCTRQSRDTRGTGTVCT